MKPTTLAILTGLGVIVALFWLIGAGALGTGDQPIGAIPGPAGDARSSPSAGTTGSKNTADGGIASASPVVAGAEAAGSGRPDLPPLVLVSPASVIPENVVTAAGQGFLPGEQVDIAVRDAPADKPLAMASATVDKDGNFYGVPITITMGTPAGERSVVGEGRKSGRRAEVTLNIAASSPFANPSSYSGKGGTDVSFEGGGFRPGEIVSLHFDSLAVDPLSQVIAGQDGGVALSGRVPLADPGDHAFFLIGAQSNSPVRVPFSLVAFSPWISPTNYSPRPQQLFGFAGHDFAPGEVVSFYRSKVDGNPIAVARADQNGEFSLDDAYELPVDAVGKNLFLAAGTHSRSVVSVTVEVQPFSPSLELSEYAGRGGTNVALKGSGYARGETVTVYLGGTTGDREMSKFRANDDGSFEGAGAFRIPPDLPAGDVTIAAVGERSRIPLEISFAVLPYTPWLGLSQYVGPPGATITFEGHDFMPGEIVTIHIGDRRSPALGTVQSDKEGNFYGGGKYTVPENADGQVTFTAYGESTHAAATATFKVGITGPDDESAPAPPDENGVPAVPVGGI